MVVSIVNILNLEGGRKSYRAILKFIRTNLHRRVIAVVRPYIARAAIKDHGQGRMEWEGGEEGEVWGLEICAQCEVAMWSSWSNPTRILHGNVNYVQQTCVTWEPIWHLLARVWVPTAMPIRAVRCLGLSVARSDSPLNDLPDLTPGWIIRRRRRRRSNVKLESSQNPFRVVVLYSDERERRPTEVVSLACSPAPYPSLALLILPQAVKMGRCFAHVQ